MRVALTGASGFLGGHTLKALIETGHTPIVLIRNRKKFDRVLDMHAIGAEQIEVIEGDVTSAPVVGRLLAEADAVIHTAAVAQIGRKHHQAIKTTNVAAAELVLNEAIARKLDPIVHVSSNSALHPPPGGRYNKDSPLTAEPLGTYAASKVEAERIARHHQDDGHPVVIVWPSGIQGPADAGLSTAAQGAIDVAKNGLLPSTSGGNLIVDVRDVAQVLAECVEPGRGPRRYGAFGQFLTWAETAATIGEATGRSIKSPNIAPGVFRAMGRIGDVISRAGIEFPLDSAAAGFMTTLVPGDDLETTSEFNVIWRPAVDTYRDQYQWLLDAGHIEAKHVPALA